MANLRTVQANMQGTLDAPAQNSFFGTGAVITDAPAQAELRYVLFRLVKKKKGRVNIDGICDNVMNPNTGKRERIWLLNGAPSIWQSEIFDLVRDKDYTRYNRRSLIFENGVLRIPIEDERAIEYARANTKNVGNRRGGNGKFDYYEYDPAEEQKQRAAKQLLKVNMVVKASQMPEAKVRPLAAFLGISFVDELGMPKTLDGIKAELMVKADTYPEMFEKYVDGNEEVEVQWLVRKALISSLIDLTAQQGTAMWANGKGFICKIPQTRKPLEYLTELAMTNSEEGKQFRQQLNDYVAPTLGGQEKSAPAETATKKVDKKEE